MSSIDVVEPSMNILLVTEGITTDAGFSAFAGMQQSRVESNGRQVLQNFMRFFVNPNSR